MFTLEKYDENRAFALLDKIGFTRVAGSSEELKAAEILKAECESFGLSAVIEPFEIESAEVEATFEILEPYRKSYTVRGYQCAESNALPVDLLNVKGKIVLVNGFLRVPLYRSLMEAGAAAVVTMDGDIHDDLENTDLHQRKLRSALRTFGNAPAVQLRTVDAMEIVNKGASRAKVTVQNKNITLTSHNVIAEIKGTEHPEQIISFGAHYDSVEFSKGVYDNGAGSVIKMEAARWFAQHPPKRTVKFCWYGSEEIGLEGSKAFVRDHKDELKDHVFMINVDVGAPILGYNTAAVTGEESLVHYTDYMLKINGLSAVTRQSIYSSDSIPFADNGIPAINFSRDGAKGAAYIHNRFDTMEFLSAEALGKTLEIVLTYADTLINAAVFPVEKKIPDNIKEDIDKYLYKKELAEAEAK